MVNYFKLINGRNFVGVASSLDFLKFQQKHRLLLLSDIEQGQYISVDGTLYRDVWMAPVTDDIITYEVVSVIEINEDEYNVLRESVAPGDDIGDVEDVEENINEEPEEPNEQPSDETSEETDKPLTISQMRGRITELEEMLNIIMGVIE